MGDTRKIIKVFLGSPGDLGQERLRAKGVVDEFNGLHADQMGYQIDLVGWEDTVSSFGRPQATINLELDRCELFVGIMWRRWGTPPDISGRFTSGFEEEFTTSLEKRRTIGKPEISMFFKDVSEDHLRDPGPDLKRVLNFKNNLIETKEVLFEAFPTTDEFEKRFRRCLTSYIYRVQDKEGAAVSEKNAGPATSGGAVSTVPTKSTNYETPLSSRGVEFLRDLIAKTENENQDGEIGAFDVARFRLLSSLLRRSGNDEKVLQVHDANLMYEGYDDNSLGKAEKLGLVECGLSHFKEEVVPFWRWYSAVEAEEGHLLLNRSSWPGWGSDQNVGALLAMLLIRESVPTSNREAYIRHWLAPDRPAKVKQAALAYLGGCGTRIDLNIIQEELARSDSQTVGVAADSVIRINLRYSRAKALAALLELQPANSDERLLNSLFANVESIDKNILLQGIVHKDKKVRKICVNAFVQRGDLDADAAQVLLNDDEPQIRMSALEIQINSGKTYSDEEAKNIIVRPGAGIFGSTDRGGEKYWKEYRRKILSREAISSLRERDRQSTIFSRDAMFAIIEREFRDSAQTLRRNIDDKYEDFFSSAMDEMATRIDADFVGQVKRFSETVRQTLTRSGLDILGRKRQVEDIGRIRKAIRDRFVGYSDEDVFFLKALGGWEDISLVIAAAERSGAQGGLRILLSEEEPHYSLAAEAIYRLAAGRLADTLSVEMPSRLLEQVLLLISASQFREFDDETIGSLLVSKVVNVRKIAALKCVGSLTKARLKTILRQHQDGFGEDRARYYNTIHWLDFGINGPSQKTRKASHLLLETMMAE
ncbi:MAG TPA: hypothetical protein VGM62_09635 [Chthoniobacterales bacterium]|jgi:hypothetical protein